MKTITLAALILAIGSGAALAEANPEYNRPFGDPFARAPAGTNLGSVAVASDSDATARLHADGYRAVSLLTRTPDGMWQGTAVRGAAKLHVTVDPQGRISVR